MDFEEMVSTRPWPVKPPASMHNEIEHPAPPFFYHQDMTGTDRVPRRAVETRGGDTTDYANEQDVKNQTLEDSAFWMTKTLEIGCYTPFVTSGLLGLYVLPVFVPSFGLGQIALSSYLVGSATYYLQNSTGPQLKKN
jgi:hypothetical protein